MLGCMWDHAQCAINIGYMFVRISCVGSQVFYHVFDLYSWIFGRFKFDNASENLPTAKFNSLSNFLLIQCILKLLLMLVKWFRMEQA